MKTPLPLGNAPTGGPAPYSPAETAVLTRLYTTATRADILAALPGRNWGSIRTKACRLGLFRPDHVAWTERYNRWQAHELDTLRQHYPTQGATAVAKLLGRSVLSVTNRAHVLGVRYAARPAKRRPAPKPPRHKVAPQPAAPAAPAYRPLLAQHDPRPKAANTLKPMQVLSSSRGNNSIHTPNANARKAQRQRAEATVKQASVTDLLRKLPANSPGRALYTNTARESGGPAAEQALRTWLTQQP